MANFKIFKKVSMLASIYQYPRNENLPRTSYESDQPLIPTPTESAESRQINQEKFCLAFVCSNDAEWTAMNQLINVHGSGSSL